MLDNVITEKQEQELTIIGAILTFGHKDKERVGFDYCYYNKKKQQNYWISIYFNCKTNKVDVELVESGSGLVIDSDINKAHQYTLRDKFIKIINKANELIMGA